MKYSLMLGCIVLLAGGCLREKYTGDDCRRDIAFVMKDVPYVFVDDEAVAYRPYYTFIEQLDLYVFGGGRVEQCAEYDFAYCREHPVIAQRVDFNSKEALFVANLYSPKELDWEYRGGQLTAVFRILDFEEPPVLLAAIAPLTEERVPVELRMLVSRVEIRLTNPPSWVTGLEVTVRNIAATVSTDYSLGDTTHIVKQTRFDNQGAGEYQFGVNTFPSYADRPALLSVTPIGTSEASPILVEDDRLHLLPGVVTRIDIAYDKDEKVTVAIEVDGKWEVVDGGSVII